jgi:hypothetical protein
MAGLDLLGRAIRLADQHILGLHGYDGPLGRLTIRSPDELQFLREKLAYQDLALRLDLLELQIEDPQLDLQTIRALMLLIQRNLLELDPEA